MTYRNQFFFFVVLLVSIVCVSCNDEPNLSGEWQCVTRSHSAIITQEGDKYLINMHFHVGNGLFNDQKLSGTYENGEIKIDPTFGTLKYSPKADRLYFHGDEFVRVVRPNKM